MIIILHLKKLRKEKNLYQKDIAEMLGVERTTYVKYENGVSEPSIEMLVKLADYYGVSIDGLLGRGNSNTTFDITNESSETDECIETIKTRPEIKHIVKLLIQSTDKDIEDAAIIIEALQKRSNPSNI